MVGILKASCFMIMDQNGSSQLLLQCYACLPVSHGLTQSGRTNKLFLLPCLLKLPWSWWCLHSNRTVTETTLNVDFWLSTHVWAQVLTHHVNMDMSTYTYSQSDLM